MAKEFYRKPNPETGRDDFYEVGTNKYIGPNEFKTGGYTEKKDFQDPRQDAPINNYSGLGEYQKNLKFTELLKEALKRKQGMNKDIQSSRDYWRTIERDPMTFTDERLRLLAPNEQQALRERRYATAGAKLQGLREEEEYRGSRIDDVIGSVTDLQEARLKDRGLEMDEEQHRMNMLKDKVDLGYETNVEDIYGSYVSEDGQRVGLKQGGTAAWRNNNPGNIKYRYGNGKLSGTAQALIDAGVAIKEGSKATDGGSFIAFPSVEEGDRAMKDLLKSGAYKNLSVEEAMRKWSGGGYGADVMTNPVSSTIGKLSDEQFNDLIDGMKKREGWKEGKILQEQKSVKHDFWTEAAVNSLALKLGEDPVMLWSTKTDAELGELAKKAGTDVVTLTANSINERQLASLGLESTEQLKQLIILIYQTDASEDEIALLLEEWGIPVVDKNGVGIIDKLDYILNPT